MDARIGTLNNGKFYAFVNGYDQAEVIGSLAQVEAALGIRAEPCAEYVVTLRFQFPAWDETAGVEFYVCASGKAEACAKARKEAFRDGHTGGGRGHYWFRAEPSA